MTKDYLEYTPKQQLLQGGVPWIVFGWQPLTIDISTMKHR